jgi:hypothetical protein
MKPANLREEAETELENLRLVCEEVQKLLADTQGREPTVRERTVAGAFLAQYYNGVENILKRFIKIRAGAMPAGDAWHITLAQMFLSGSGSGMPVLFTAEQFAILALYRRCRHAVRNSYGHEFKLEQTGPRSGSLAWSAALVRGVGPPGFVTNLELPALGRYHEQLSKLESGENCNILTYLKASRALGYKLTIQPI